MLVQIPSTSDAIDDRGRLYKVDSGDICTERATSGGVTMLLQVFNIYIGGHYHCSLRYSHLLHFSQEVQISRDNHWKLT